MAIRMKLARVVLGVRRSFATPVVPPLRVISVAWHGSDL
jgi:hypothetical protein